MPPKARERREKRARPPTPCGAGASPRARPRSWPRSTPRSTSTGASTPRTSPARRRTAAMLVAAAHHRRRATAQAIQGGLDRILAEIESRQVRVPGGARGHPHECRGAARRADRPGRRAPAHRALAQRPGRDRFPAVGARRDRRASTRQARDLQRALIDQAEAHAGAVMPGFTHLQPAQPVTLRAPPARLCRDDRARPRRGSPTAARRLNESPLGAAALAGTVVPDRPRGDRQGARLRPGRRQLARRASRTATSRSNSSSALSIAGVHLSRLAEELVLWTTPQFGFVRLSDAFSTGSSIMPQKRNPDAAELVRAKTGELDRRAGRPADGDEGPAAHLRQGHAGGQGSAPSQATDALTLAFAAMTGMIDDMTVHEDALRRAAGAGFAHRDRSRRLDGAQARPAVPRGAPRHRPDREARRGQGRRPRGAAARRHAARSRSASPRTCSAC